MDDVYYYSCNWCGADFTSEVGNPKSVVCKRCGSRDVDLTPIEYTPKYNSQPIQKYNRKEDRHGKV